MVSIITPTYNSKDYISHTIQSVLNQTYSDWEMIIVDDCSSDNTCDIVTSFIKKDSRISLTKLNKNSGAGIARNKGVELAKGDYIAFLDADDLWKPHKLETQIKFMSIHNLSFTFSSYEQINELGKPLHIKIEALPTLNYSKLKLSNYVGNLTGIYNAKKLGKISIPSMRKRQDWAHWIQVISKSGKTKSISESLAYYRVRKDSISSNKLNLLKYNYIFYRKGLNFAPLKSVIYLIRFLFEQFFVKSKQTKSLQ